MGTPPGLLDYETTNALLAWALVGVALVVAVERVLSGEYLEGGFAAVVAAVGVVPASASGRPREMGAWEVLGVAVAPLVGPYVGVLEGQAAYVGVAAVALLVAVELEVFTAVEMVPEFAVAFVVVLTLAVAGVWVLARYASDVLVGTSLLPDLTSLMWDLVAATGVGVVAGLAFELYVRRVSPGRELVGESRGEGGR